MNTKLTRIFAVSASILAAIHCIAKPTKPVDFFAENAVANAVGLLQHPAGQHHNGITYVAYQGSLTDPYVAAYNHTTDTWTGPFKAGTSELSKNGSKTDSHGKPALIIDDAGYIHVIFGGHGADESYGKNPRGNTHHGRMIHIVSKRPLDITEWEELDNIPPFGTYGHLAKLSNGDIYYFFRHGAHRSHWVYQISRDNGRTFEEPISVVKNLAHTDDQGRKYQDSWYCHFSVGPDEQLLVTYTYHKCWNIDVPHSHEQRNVYVMTIDTRDGTCRNLQGEQIALPITKDLADQKTLAVRTPEHQWTSLGVGHLGSNGMPHIMYTAGDSRGRRFKGPEAPYYFRYDGKQWTGSKNAFAPELSRGDMKFSPNGEIRTLIGGLGKVAWWKSTDGGLTFSEDKIVLANTNSRYLVSSLFSNAHPNAQALVAEIDRSSDSPNRRMYLVGNDGPIKR